MKFPGIDDLPALSAMPDPLAFWNRKASAASVREWEEDRAFELADLFQHYMYGTMPLAASVTGAESEPPRPCCEGKAVYRQIRLSCDRPGCPEMALLLITPAGADAAAPSPVFLGLNFGGNHTVLEEPGIDLPRGWMPNSPGVEENRATDAGRGRGVGAWCAQRLIERGYALATIYAGDIVADRSDIGRDIFPSFGMISADCGVISAWAWGLHRVVDFLLEYPAIDSRRIAVFGHSRNGKAALLAGASDPRIALTVSHQSGCGGAAPNRCHNPKAETVTRITSHFPLWFGSRFAEFGGREDRLPFDQNGLVALCAPRPVLLTCGDLDQWADPSGQFDALRAARGVYRLYGVEGIADNISDPVLDCVLGSTLAWYCRSEAKHVVDDAFWNTILDFADHSFS